MTLSTHRLAAIWFADISRYSRLARADEQASLALVRTFQAIARREIPRFGGHAVKLMGDGVMAEFPSALGAVQAALALTAAYRSEVPGELVDEHGVRSAIHVGEVNELDDGDLYGDGVNVAARILSEAEPGDVLVSEDVRRLLRGQRALAFRALGERDLRGIGRLGLYSVRSAGTLVQAPPSTPISAPRRSGRRGVALLAGMAAILLILVIGRWTGIDPSAAWVGFRASVNPAMAGPVATSIAVLPFEGEDLAATGAPGFTDAIVGRLGTIPDFTVIAANSADRVGVGGATSAEAARALGVESVLRGSVSRRRGEVRVDARLVRGENGEVLWRRSWVRPATDLAALQIEIAERIVDALRLELSPGARGRVRAPSSPSAEAHRLYQEGLHHWNRRNDDGVRRSIDLFRRSLDEDPGYAAAYSGLAAAYVIAPAYAGVPRESAEAWARAAAEKAIALDPGLGQPHAVLGLIAFHEWEWETAESEFRQAIALGPGSATAHHWYGVFLAAMVRYEEARTAFDRAERLDPLSLPVVSARAVVHFNQGELDRAIEQQRKALAMDPTFGPAHGNLVETYLVSGRYEEAIREMREGGRPAIEVDELDRALTSRGPRGFLTALAGSMEAGGATAFELAVVRAALGDVEGCLEWLEQSYRRREPGLVDLATHPGLEPVRDHPRVRDLLARLGLS